MFQKSQQRVIELNPLRRVARMQRAPQTETDARSRVDRHLLVIGGAGYIGNVLIRKLLTLGYRVRCMDALYYPTGHTIAPLIDNDRFSFVLGDLRNVESRRDALVGITDVVLLASLVGDPISKKYPEMSREVNQTASCRLFSELAGRGLKKFVFTSTCSTYGIIEGNKPATESSPVSPRSVYAETKVAFEEYVLRHSNSVDFSPTILRLATAFGLSPRMRFDLTISEFSRELALGNELVVYDESTWRPYCHVSDISDAIIKVIEAPTDVVYGQVFNVGGNKNNFTKRMIVDELRHLITDAKIGFKRGGADTRDYRVSFDKIRATLDFEPVYTVPNAIAKVVSCVNAGLYADVDENEDFYGNYAVSPEEYT